MQVPAPSELTLPYEKWRTGQPEAVEWLLRDDVQSVQVLEAPTGTGKTGIVLGAAMLDYEDARWLILCATRVEQEQYERNATEDTLMVSIQGKRNYHCSLIDENLDKDGPCIEPDCERVHVDDAPCAVGTVRASKCEMRVAGRCPYYNVLAKAKRSKIVVTNYAFALNMLNYAPGGMGDFEVIVCDEGHILSEQMERFMAIRLNFDTFDFWITRTKLNTRKLSDDVMEWRKWAEDNYFEIRGELKERRDSLRLRPGEETRFLRDMSRIKGLEETIGRLSADVDENWVAELTGRNRSTMEFMPVWLGESCENMLLNHADRIVVMSGTIPPREHFGKSMGISPRRMTFKRLPYPFPVDNRPIHILPVARLTRTEREQGLPRLVEEMNVILDDHSDVKGLIHTNSYDIMEYILNEIDMDHAWRFIWHADSDERSMSLKDFRGADFPAVLISPSMDKAVDFPGKQCEFIIVAKLPFPYMGTKLMQARTENDYPFYRNMALLTLRQMIGRGARSEDDVCPVYILDASAMKFLRGVARDLTPDFRGALILPPDA